MAPADVQKKCGIAAIVVFLLALGCGTGATLSSKVLFDMQVENSAGDTVKFTKPLMVTFIMFVAMAIALPLHVLLHVIADLQAGTRTPLPKVATHVWFVLAAPAVTDLLGTTCAMIGLVYVKVSVYQLVRASVIVFVAVYRVSFGMANMYKHNWLGVGMNVTAITAIGSSAFFDPSAGSNVPLGIGVLLIGCSIMAAQLVLEEKVMAGDGTPPLIVVGMEGVWGTLIMLCIIFPIAARAPGYDIDGCYESFSDAVYMLNDPTNEALRVTCMFYLLCITGYNVCAIFITQLLESVWRSILENFRPAAVWITDLLLFYIFTAGTFGEAWTVWSWLELVGMIVLLTGTAVYNGSVTVPGFEPPAPFQSLVKHPSLALGDKILGSPMIQRADSITGEPRRGGGGDGEKTRIIGYANTGGSAGYSTIPGNVQEP